MPYYRVSAYRDPLAPGVDVVARDQWISDSSYREIVEKSIIVCTDTVLTISGDSALYLPKRSILPMRGIWSLGGRMFFNDRTLEESAARCIELETSIRINPKRFLYVCTQLYSWIKVAQGDFPGKALSNVYMCEVTREEIDKMRNGLLPKEFDCEFGIQRFNRIRLIDENVHQAMLDVYDLLFPQRR